MPLALLHSLARPLSLRAQGKGLVGAARTLLTLTGSPGCQGAVVAAMRRDVVVVWKAPLARCCLDSTTTRQLSRPMCTYEEEEKVGARTSSLTGHTSKAHHTDLQDKDPLSPDDFMLPSQYQRYQSDRLEQKINECNSADVALEIFHRHHDVMGIRHCLTLMRRLGDLASSGSKDCTYPQVLQDETFEALCSFLFKQCRRMDTEELVGLLKALCRLEVPSEAKLTQAVLQMLKSQINDLNLKQLLFLEFLLKKMPLTPLSDALLTAVPILLSNAITSTPLADLSFFDLSQALSICSQGRVDGMGALLQEMYQRGSVRNVSMAISAVWTLTELSHRRTIHRLLTTEEQLTREIIMKEGLESIARQADDLTLQQMESTLTKVSEGYKKGDRSCYNESFLHAAALCVCSKSDSFEHVAHTIRKLMEMHYLSEELVHHTLRLVLSRPEEVPEARVPLSPLMAAIAACTSLPKDRIRQALDILMTHKSLRMDTEYYYKKPLLMFAVDLLGVGYLHPPLMSLLTSPDSLSMFMSKYSKDNNNQKRLVMVDEALSQMFHSAYRVPEPFLEPGKRLMATLPPSRSGLKAILLQILKDPACLVSGVLTEGGTYIDHLLALDPEGIPIRLSSGDPPLMKNPSITTLELPPEATKVAILDLGSTMVLRPANAIQGSQRLRQAILETAGFQVVLMLQSVIYQHHEEEKLLYVKRELSSVGGVVLS